MSSSQVKVGAGKRNSCPRKKEVQLMCRRDLGSREKVPKGKEGSDRLVPLGEEGEQSITKKGKAKSA